MEDNKIQFDENTHVYSRNNNNYISVTTLLKKYGLSANYAGIPTDVLQKAAQRGTAIHKAFENYIKSNGSVMPQAPDLGSLEVPQLQSYIINRNIDLMQAQSERIIYDDNYLVAGTLDFTYYDNNDKVIADFKTTSSIHSDAVSWQLSIYNYMLCNGDVIEYYTTRLMVFQFYQGKFIIKELPAIDYQEVINLLEANKNGTPYTYVADTSKIISDSESQVLESLLREINMYENTLTKLKNKYETLIAPLSNRMHKALQNNVVINNTLRIKLSDASIRKTLDTKAVTEWITLHGGNIDAFYKTSQVRESIKVTLIK